MAEPKRIILSSGKIRYRLMVEAGRDENGKRIQLTVTRDTAKECRAERDRILHQRSAGTFIAPNKITLGEWLDQWLEHKRRDVEETTIRTYRMALVHVDERLGHVRLQELTEDQVQDFLDALVATGRRKGGLPGTRLAVSTVLGILTRLREALGRAVVRKLIPVNPAQYVTVSLADRKTDKRERERPKPWTVIEVQTFIRGIADDRLCAPLLLSLMGMRPAEVCGQRWLDVDLDAGLLSITLTRTMVGNHLVLEKDTKTAAGERGLPLPRGPWEALRAFQVLQLLEKELAGEGYADTGYVTVDELGLPLNTRQLREYAYRLMRRLGLRQVRLYDARHAVLKALALAGVPDVILAAWAGHTNAAFTKRRYVSIEPEDMRGAADALDVFHGVDQKADVRICEI
ncbi:site-specific integrase [Streptomyces albireticuli]|uniref:Site-specific integrase n=1 Tax=Streptomyces albireticuli TaxID=1940 RepID=A0A2A2CZR7_9ACTN|nr:site-specific integrase [Streptomyces albireticuli]MCD9145780.1 site-specific integrase [Streptomyces albireticuli]MCD9165857.1 site-specific integrase [Streptomyces albireticuli]MCD9194464.1 site-specific integrase [Streptomyces albireticuli]PAU44580.1 site-specific integrase [Streptomyces albireticuli]